MRSVACSFAEKRSWRHDLGQNAARTTVCSCGPMGAFARATDNNLGAERWAAGRRNSRNASRRRQISGYAGDPLRMVAARNCTGDGIEAGALSTLNPPLSSSCCRLYVRVRTTVISILERAGRGQEALAHGD